MSRMHVREPQGLLIVLRILQWQLGSDWLRLCFVLSGQQASNGLRGRQVGRVIRDEQVALEYAAGFAKAR